MTLEQIKAAVQSGAKVHWMNAAYIVVCDSLGQWLIKYRGDGGCIGLTHRDGVTMNGRPWQFYTAD
jgi:hypothetical protein